MSDFIFSDAFYASESLARRIREVSLRKNLEIQEFHGAWGSLAVSAGPYNGFSPFETEKYICVVVGGPVLYWRNNKFLVETDHYEGTRSILERWQQGNMDWSEDLSGPFTVLIINKISLQVNCVTDLMMFIPLYKSEESNYLTLGTHVDAVSRASGNGGNWDEVSIADFVLHNVVTYPYTAYKKIKQLEPAAVHCIEKSEGANESEWTCIPYWVPSEQKAFENITEAAAALRDGVGGYIAKVTEGMDEIAQFISAGEDSRSLCGLLPKHLKRQAHVFLDSMNKEGQLAKKIAETYGCDFHYQLRSATHYLQILPAASRLIGSGQQYTHAHTLGLSDKAELQKLRAVFGGYASDALLKGVYTRKPHGWSRFPFLPDIALLKEDRTTLLESKIFSKEICQAVQSRREEHMKRTKKIRPKTCHEWFVLWPFSMREAMPNIATNRRLFASYEIFTSKEVVKISASVPTSWKLNRRLFNKAMKPALQKSKWIRHADGRFPYFVWWINVPMQFPTWFMKNILRLFKYGVNQGPWGDWRDMSQSQEWKSWIQQSKCKAKQFYFLDCWVNKKNLLESTHLSIVQKVNLIQTIETAATLESSQKKL